MNNHEKDPEMRITVLLTRNIQKSTIPSFISTILVPNAPDQDESPANLRTLQLSYGYLWPRGHSTVVNTANLPLNFLIAKRT